MENIIQNDKYRPLLAFFCAVGWSLAYPFIKLGYAEFQISQDDLGSKILFAGIRFLFAGIILLLFSVQRRKTIVPKEIPWKMLLLFALVNTTLHYLFAYIGLSYLPSSRATIIDSMNGFLLILFACAIFPDDHMDLQKIIGCILGFAGIVMINVTPGQSLFQGISFCGDGLVLLNALFGACGGLITRFISKKMDMTVATGFSMAIGGTVLCLVAGIVHPSNAWHITGKGIAILLVLTVISAVCFEIYNLLLSYHPISKVAIFNAFIPVLGVIFSSALLKEPLKAQYVIACVVVALGVMTANLKVRKTEEP